MIFLLELILFLTQQEDVDKAVAAARAAFKSNAPWRTMDASERAALMHKVNMMLIATTIGRELVEFCSGKTVEVSFPSWLMVMIMALVR